MNKTVKLGKNYVGDDYPTSDGTCIRDYIHVVDLAKSHVLAMNFLIKNPGKHAFNVGTGIGISVLDAVKAFEKTNNLKNKNLKHEKNY